MIHGLYLSFIRTIWSSDRRDYRLLYGEISACFPEHLRQPESKSHSDRVRPEKLFEQKRGFKPKVSFVGRDVDAIKGLVSAGLGVTLIPEVTLVDSLPRETVRVRVTDPKLTRSVGAIIPTDRELLPTEKLFLDFITEYFTRLEEFQN